MRVLRLDAHALAIHLDGNVDVVVVNILLAFRCVYPGKHEKDPFFQTQMWRKFILYHEKNDNKNCRNAGSYTSH